MTLTDSAISLRDWIADQVAEVRHHTHTDGVTALDYVLAPGLDSRPACQWNHDDPTTPQCDSQAVWRVHTHIADTITGHHGDTTVLLCDHHWARFLANWIRILTSGRTVCCALCRRPFRRLDDVATAGRL